MTNVKKSLIALFSAIAAVLALGMGASSAFAEDYGATVTATGNTVAFTIPSGTFDSGSDIILSWTDTNISTILKAGSVTYQADDNGGFSGKVVFSSAVTESTTIVATGTKDGSQVEYTIKVLPTATGEGTGTTTTTHDQSGTTATTTASTGATVLPIVGGIVLLAVAAIAILLLRKKTSR